MEPAEYFSLPVLEMDGAHIWGITGPAEVGREIENHSLYIADFPAKAGDFIMKLFSFL